MPYVASLPISTARVQEAKRDRKNLQRCTRLVEECATAMLHSRDSKLSMALATALHVNTLLREPHADACRGSGGYGLPMVDAPAPALALLG